jgi:DNA polymerase (family X)
MLKGDQEGTPMPSFAENDAVAQLLDNIARLLTIQDADPFRIRAYADASRAIATLDEDIRELHRAGALEEIDGVGPSICAKIAEFLETGRSTYYEELKQSLSPGSTELLDLPSIGPGRARLIQEHLGIATAAELERAAREHRLQALPGIGEKLERRIEREARRAARQPGRLLEAAIPATSS